MTTRPVLLRPWTGADYWFLDDMCRGERPGDAEPYCRRRDDVLKRIGAVNAHGFARAWQRRDEPTMRRLATNQSAVDVALTIRLRRAAPDCEHDASFPSWWCSVQATDGRWTGARSEVVRYERPGLPLWRVVAAGSPDV